MICNACSTTSGFSWLSDETEWTLEDIVEKTSNVDTVAHFCTWSLGKPGMKEVQEAAIKLAYNLSIPEITDQLAEQISATLLKLLTQPGPPLTDAAVQDLLGALTNFSDVSTQVRNYPKTNHFLRFMVRHTIDVTMLFVVSFRSGCPQYQCSSGGLEFCSSEIPKVEGHSQYLQSENTILTNLSRGAPSFYFNRKPNF